MPIVTVLVNTFNHQSFIAKALSSIVEQDFPAADTEIIVVDDGSTDLTPEIVRQFLPRIKLFRKQNGGQVSAVLEGLAHASGEIIAFLDGDDWWTPDKLSKVIDAFDRHPQIAAVGHGYYEVNEQGTSIRTMTTRSECRLSCETPENARNAANLRVFGGTSRMALRRKAIDQLLPVPLILPYADNFIFSQAIALSGAALLPDLLCYYRLHSKNIYASESFDEQRFRRRLEHLEYLSEYLPPRLKTFGVSNDAISAFLEFDRIDAKRLRLILDGGTPLGTFRAELSAFRSGYRNPDIGYTFFKMLVLFVTLITPPKTFYRLRQWYTQQGLMRFRQRIGRGTPTVPEVKARPII
jgi:glycosyltransferase involved in cell wall biosynthesis